MLEIGFIVSAFIAGILTFLAPCTLPLIPAYLAMVSGANGKDVKNWKVFSNGVFFVLGFTIVFVILGVLSQLFGQLLAPYIIWLTRVGAVFVILFGLYLTGIFKLNFLNFERRFHFEGKLQRGKNLSAFIIGATFAFGWTPCVGPILSSILFLAAFTKTALDGALLLFVFSIGLAIPFLLTALFYSRISSAFSRLGKFAHYVSVLAGIFLIFVGILLLINKFGVVVQYGYDLFDVLGWEGLYEYF